MVAGFDFVVGAGDACCLVAAEDVAAAVCGLVGVWVVVFVFVLVVGGMVECGDV